MDALISVVLLWYLVLGEQQIETSDPQTQMNGSVHLFVWDFGRDLNCSRITRNVIEIGSEIVDGRDG